MRTKPCSWIVALAWLATSGPAWAGCKDTDCKGDRICVDGSCQDPAPPTAVSPTCLWPRGAPVSAGLRDVRVGESVHAVRGREAREAFVGVLQQCGAEAVVPAFERWREVRRQANIAGIGGAITLVLVPPAGVINLSVVLPIQCVRARNQKNAFVEALSAAWSPR